MAVIDLRDDGLSRLGPALAFLGEGLGQLIDPDRALREELTARALLDPEFGAQVAEAQRRAELANIGAQVAGMIGGTPVATPNIFEDIGMEDEVMRQILALNFPTLEEQTRGDVLETTKSDLETRQDVNESVRAGAEVSRQTDVLRLLRGQPQRAVDAEVSLLDLQTKQSKLAARDSEVAAEAAKFRNLVHTEAYEALLDAAEVLPKEEFLNIAAAIGAPSYLPLVAQREGFENQMALLRMRLDAASNPANIDPVAKYELLLKVNSANRDAVELLSELDDPQERAAVFASVADGFAMRRDIFPQGQAVDLTGVIDKGWLGLREPKFEFKVNVREISEATAHQLPVIRYVGATKLAAGESMEDVLRDITERQPEAMADLEQAGELPKLIKELEASQQIGRERTSTPPRRRRDNELSTPRP